MQIEIKDITDGKFNGKKLWICDFRFSDYNNSKPIRHIKPVQVLVCSNSDLPKNKTVYYSESHLKKISKKGEPLKSGIIAPFDNTGYRSYTGTPLNAFDDKKECIEFYKKQCESVAKGWKEWRKNKIEFIDKQIQDIYDNIDYCNRI